jgi:hypothetical protein
MSDSNPVAIVRKVFTISITFVNKPSDTRRQQLKDAGYRFENGQWYKSHPEGHHADDATVADLIAAS